MSSALSPTPAGHLGDDAGFSTHADGTLGRFTIHLAGSAEPIRDIVAAAGGEADAVSGLSLSVAPGNIVFDDSPPDGEIHVTIASDSPCGPLGGDLLGCGGYQYREQSGRRIVTAGMAWIGPNLERWGPDMLRATVLHELGHAFGLEHYDALHDGQRQVMQSVTKETFASYQSGDRAGLLFLAPQG